MNRLGKYICKEAADPANANMRVDMQNAHFLATFDGRAYFAPGADTAQRVLDVGTGTGIWAIQFGFSPLFAVVWSPG